MEITVLSTQAIKPSSPTPPHLRHHKLSLIDQGMPRTYFIPILLFYPAQGDKDRFWSTSTTDRLKKSLCMALTEFYPIAGNYKDDRSVLCSDEGLEYVEAQVKAPYTLAQVLSNPQAEELDRFLPLGAHKLSTIQVTMFDVCGGMVIGVGMSHGISDASSLLAFVKHWAAIARGDHTLTTMAPVFDFASVFPPRDLPLNHLTEETDWTPGRVVFKRFVLHQKKIEALKANIHVNHCPTRVEAVCALLFKCFINASQVPSSKAILLGIPINLRSKMSPPLGVQHFGNFALLRVMEQTGPLSLNDLAVQLNKMMREIDNDYVEKLQAEHGQLLYELLETMTQVCTMPSVQLFSMTSWCRLPFYEVDFGWGAPEWVAPCHASMPAFMLMDTKNGDGIEAWVGLDEDAMSRFEFDKEFLDYASPNPGIL